MAKKSCPSQDNVRVNLTKLLKKYSFAILIIALTILEKSAVPCTFLFFLKFQKEYYQEQIALIKGQISHNQEQISQFSRKSQTYKQDIDRLNQKVKNNSQKIEKTETSVKQLQRVNNLTRGKVDRSNHQQKLNSVELSKQQKQIDSLSQKINELEVNIAEQSNQKKPLTIIETLPQGKAITAHISIDGNNFWKSSQKLGLSIDWQRLAVSLADIAGTVDRIQIKYYTGIRHNMIQEPEKWFKDRTQLKYEVIPLPISQRDNGENKTVGDDIKLAIDLSEDVQANDRVVLLSGDGDFIPLVEKLLARNIKVTVIGALNNTSNEWYQQFTHDNHFKLISLEAIAHKIVRLKKIAS